MTDQIVSMDSCDLYSNTSSIGSLGKYVVFGGSRVAYTATGGRFGGGAIHLQSYGSGFNLVAPNGITACIIGVSVSFENDQTGTVPFLSFFSLSGVECSLWLNMDTNQIVARSGYSGSTIWSSGSLAGLLTNWYRLEVYASIGSSGYVGVAINGVTVGAGMTTTGNTNAAGGTSISQIRFGVSDGSSNNAPAYLDDIVLRDLTGTSIGSVAFYGDGRINVRAPSSDASPNNGTPASGTDHFAMVDSIPYDTSKYITLTNTSGQEELYGFPSISGSVVSVYAVQVTLVAEKTDAGSALLEPVLKSGSTVSNGGTLGSFQLGTNYGAYSSLWLTDPNTSSAWTLSAVSSAQAGYEVP